MCATLGRIDGHLTGTRLLGSVGRLFCFDVRRSSGAGPWEYEVLLDPRKSEKSQSDATRFWISGLVRNSAIDGLWEAEILDEAGEEHRLLRLNANPPSHLRPSKRVRAAVTRMYEETLFPHGLVEAARETAMPR